MTLSQNKIVFEQPLKISAVEKSQQYTKSYTGNGKPVGQCKSLKPNSFLSQSALTNQYPEIRDYEKLLFSILSHSAMVYSINISL